MRAIRHAFAHLWSRPLLTFLLIAGSVIAVAIPMALPIYADAATERALANQSFQDRGYRPPFAYLFFFSSSLDGPYPSVLDADAYLRGEGLQSLGLPTLHESGFLDTTRYRVEDTSGEVLGFAPLATMTDWRERITIRDGKWPEVSTEAVEVLVHYEVAEEWGVVPGDRLLATVPESLGPGAGDVPFFVSVAGVWEATNPDDPEWIIAPDQLQSRLFVDREVIVSLLAASDRGVLSTAAWYAIVDSSGLSVEDVDPLLNRASIVTDRAQEILPGIDLTVDPVAGLNAFRANSTGLTRRLLAYSAPTLALILMFVVLVVTLTTNDRRSEIAVLRSRGAGRSQIMARVGIESAVVVGVGFGLAVPLSLVVASWLGRVITFLSVGPSGTVTVSLSPRAIQVGGIVALVVLALQMAPIWGVTRFTVVDESVDLVDRQRPWWQRSSLDLIVIVAVAIMGYNIVSSEPDAVSDIQDPVNILFPAMVTFAVGLAALRLLPIALELVARALGHTPSITALLAFRRAARGAVSNHVPLLLLVVTVGLGIFIASLARTLDLQTADRSYHLVGADWVVQEPHSAAAPSIGGVLTGPRQLSTMGEFESIPGVALATRVGTYPGRTIGGGDVSGLTFFGIDHTSFVSVAFYRSDFSRDGESVAAILGRLGEDPEAVVVHRSLGFARGEVIDFEVGFSGNTVGLRGVVVGVLDNFPTWVAEDHEPFVIGNLERLFLETGDPGGYEVWMSVDTPDAVSPHADMPLLFEENPNTLIAEELARPDRQGGFGVLSAGFVASIAVSLIGFLVAAMFRVRASIVELGAIQAIGLRPWRVAGVVVVEMAVLMTAGLVVGVGMGWWLGQWMIVRLTGDAAATASLPLLPEMGTDTTVFVVVALCGLFVATSVALVAGLRRLRVFEVLKLGETQ